MESRDEFEQANQRVKDLQASVPRAVSAHYTKEHTNMKPKNTICLWFDKDAHEAARFYSVTFPDSKVTAVHEAPGDYPGGKKGNVLTVEFTVLSIPCLGLNGGPAFRHTEAFSFQIATENDKDAHEAARFYSVTFPDSKVTAVHEAPGDYPGAS